MDPSIKGLERSNVTQVNNLFPYDSSDQSF